METNLKGLMSEGPSTRPRSFCDGNCAPRCSRTLFPLVFTLCTLFPAESALICALTDPGAPDVRIGGGSVLLVVFEDGENRFHLLLRPV